MCVYRWLHRIRHFRKQSFEFYSNLCHSVLSSVNRIGSLRSQTQYSDISSEKRSPRTTVRLSIKQSNGSATQANNLQITLNAPLNGLGTAKANGQNARSRSLNKSMSCSKASPSLKVERTKSAQPDEADGTNKKRNEIADNRRETVTVQVISDEDRNEKVNENNQRSSRTGETESDQPDQFGSKAQPNDDSSNRMRRPIEGKEEAFPKLEKLIHREMKKLNGKQFSSRLIRCKTAVEIDDYMSDSKGRSKAAQKLIFSETIG